MSIPPKRGKSAAAPLTTTVTLRAGLTPPAPEHVRENVLVAVMLLNVSLPEVGLLPLQSPAALQEVAFVEDQVSCVLPPLATVVGLAFNVAVGAGATFTVTLTLDTALERFRRLHCNENVVVVARLRIVCLPETALLPPQPPDAVHELAFVDDHVNNVLPPWLTDVGLALSVAVGRIADLICDAPAYPAQAIRQSSEK